MDDMLALSGSNRKITEFIVACRLDRKFAAIGRGRKVQSAVANFDKCTNARRKSVRGERQLVGQTDNRNCAHNAREGG